MSVLSRCTFMGFCLIRMWVRFSTNVQLGVRTWNFTNFWNEFRDIVPWKVHGLSFLVILISTTFTKGVSFYRWSNYNLNFIRVMSAIVISIPLVSRVSSNQTQIYIYHFACIEQTYESWCVPNLGIILFLFQLRCLSKVGWIQERNTENVKN